MSWFNLRKGSHPTLARRFGLSFAAILALFLALAGVSQFLLSTLSARMRGIVEVNNQQMALANTMIVQVADMALALRTLTLLTEVKDIDAEVGVLRKTQEAYLKTEKELADALVAHGASEIDRDALGQIIKVRERTLPLIAKAAQLGADGATPEATLVLMNEVRPVERQWRALASEFARRQTELNASAYAEARNTQETATIALSCAGLAAVVAGALLAWRLSAAVVQPVNDAIRVAESIAGGDLSNTVATTRRDELGRLLMAISSMQHRLRTLVGDIRHSADSISTASAEIAMGNLDLSQRTEQQAASLQKTTANVGELTGTVRDNATSALQADALARSASQVAARGGDLVDQVVATMADISTSSQRIVDIISVIDSIAFQTNILALNAAVEAARAGEQGRGFAVVAGEVRQLAQRSAEAAREIKTLINASGERVHTGSRIVTDAGATMREIVASIHRVSEIMSGLNTSSQAQRSGIEAVGGEVEQLDTMTQQNAALVEQSAAATESLKEQTHRLTQAVRVFRLH
ncbi:methyl-accepting chemotaxis protein [Rhizobacter sp. Root1221]|uniref:methyl-accepting chemotaxis protein n=1 Tax=Rhizobacter sp. Root1221 TaxID=1736433 RepID=UPI0006F7FF9C|nr:methyl-accepting chemotaxis protein [Rhizobacter sp. Root1221]KQV78215.1 hypothetical protein ASC87_11465 [Rhizobacter sp. Root1221]